MFARDVAKILKVSPERVRQLARAGRLRFRVVEDSLGTRYVFRDAVVRPPLRKYRKAK